MRKIFKYPTLIMPLATSLIYIIAAFAICIKSKASVFEYIAAIIPLFIVLISSAISIKSSLWGGVLLSLEGTLFSHFILSNFHFTKVFMSLLVFGFPLIASGLILIYKSVNNQRMGSYKFAGINRFFS